MSKYAIVTSIASERCIELRGPGCCVSYMFLVIPGFGRFATTSMSRLAMRPVAITCARDRFIDNHTHHFRLDQLLRRSYMDHPLSPTEKNILYHDTQAALWKKKRNAHARINQHAEWRR
jgi:hypothetical protein